MSFAGICRSSSDSNQRLTRKGIDRFATSAILNGEQSKLTKIQAARVNRRLVRLVILSATGRTRCGERDRARLRDRNYKRADQGDVEMSHVWESNRRQSHPQAG